MDKIWHIGWWRLYSAGSTRLDDKKSKAWARLRLGSGSLSLARAKKIGLIPLLVQITQLDYSGVANNHFGLRDSIEFSKVTFEQLVFSSTGPGQLSCCPFVHWGNFKSIQKKICGKLGERKKRKPKDLRFGPRPERSWHKSNIFRTKARNETILASVLLGIGHRSGQRQDWVSKILQCYVLK